MKEYTIRDLESTSTFMASMAANMIEMEELHAAKHFLENIIENLDNLFMKGFKADFEVPMVIFDNVKMCLESIQAGNTSIDEARNFFQEGIYYIGGRIYDLERHGYERALENARAVLLSQECGFQYYVNPSYIRDMFK